MCESNSQPRTNERRVRKPIIILGCARSATSMMGRILSHHPDVAYWPEPRPIWMYGNAYRTHDELTAADLSPRIARFIDQRFGEFLSESGKPRFMEKTPSNCLRIPFIHALYPDCRLINIIRDGRHVVRSMLQMQSKPPRKGLLSQRLRETPFWEWPAYVPMFFRTAWRTKVLRKRSSYWGPRPAGWREWMDLPRHMMVAEQWRAIVAATLRDGRALPAENYLELRYETLMRSPVDVIQQALEFVNLSKAPEVIAYTRSHIDPTRTHKWKGTLNEKQEQEVAALLMPLLRELEYPFDSSSNAEAGQQQEDLDDSSDGQRT